MTWYWHFYDQDHATKRYRFREVVNAFEDPCDQGLEPRQPL
jgi:hypothetical protein